MMNTNAVPDNFAKRLYVLLLKRAVNKRLISISEIIQKFGLSNDAGTRELVIVPTLGTIDSLNDIQESPRLSTLVFDGDENLIYPEYWIYPDICNEKKKLNTEKIREHLFNYYDL